MTGVSTDSQQAAAVVVEREDAVAIVTLNMPSRRNALTRELKESLLGALREVSEDGSVRAVVLTGAGDKAFCVGQDLGEHAEALRADAATAFGTVQQHYNPVLRTLVGMPQPTVAAINGACVGAGLGFALACDLRVAAAGVSFATAFTAIGLTADSGLSTTLVHALGASRATELMLLGEPFTAERAAEWGLVREVVAAEDIRETAVSLARKLAAGPTRAYAEVKAALRLGATATLDEVLDAEAAAQARLGVTRDHQAAVQAFLAKERPTFEGR